MNSRLEQFKSNTFKISVIVPVFNEAEGLAHFVDQLYQILDSYKHQLEVLLINDASSDHSLEVLESLSLRYPLKFISLSRNFGKEIALTAGIDHCSGDIAVLIDADFQHPFAVISQFIEKWLEGYDMVYGVRDNRSDESWLKKKLTALFYELTKKFSEVSIPKDAGDFRLLDRKVIDALKALPERHRFMKGLYAWVGFKSIGIPFTVQQRISGKSSWSFHRLLELALNGFFAFSNMPLRIWTLIGLSISFISLIYSLWIVFTVLYFGVDLPGFATIAVAVIFFGGIQLISIGILGEYIGRIFTEVKARPHYFIVQKKGFDN